MTMAIRAALLVALGAGQGHALLVPGAPRLHAPRLKSTALPVALNVQVQYAIDAANPFWRSSLEGYEAAAAREEGAMFETPAFKFFDFLFGIPIVHDIMFGVYRKQIVEKSEKLGLPWASIMEEQMSGLDRLKSRAEAMRDPKVVVPDYYYAPIHAYKEGNLCWESAMEEDLWSKMMIAPLYNNALDGDVQMRANWLSITGRVVENPKTATDLGCGTGLSMYMLTDKWPSIESVTGVDMSTFKLAISDEKKSEMAPEKAAKYTLVHGPAETTSVASGSQDLVSLCLVAHESPAWVTKSIFAEAYRILKPGGSFTMLDLDKENLENLLENPFVAAVYKQTEPYMGEFLKLDPKTDLPAAGFEVTQVDNASRSHRVYVARKPELV
jgi:ubiquinone/menaquinone biosynthesis C-methylase UbiE